MNQQLKWDQRFLKLAREIATWSKDPTTQVGCVIVDYNNVIIGTGYNGFPRGTLDTEALLANKEVKRLRVVHAEMNAIHFSTKSLKGATLYCTHHPCAPCAASIIQHEPFRIVIPKQDSELGVDWTKSVNEAKAMFDEAEVRFEEVEI